MPDNELSVEARLHNFISAEMDTMAKNVDEAATKISNSTKQTGDSAEKAGASFGQMATGAGTALIAIEALKKAADFAKDAISDYDKQAVAVYGLDKAYGEESESLKALAESKMNTTRYGKDETLIAENMLKVHHLSAEQIKQLIPVIMDFTAQNAATGATLTSTTEAFSRAIEYGTLRGLRPFGIELETTGSQMDIFNNLIKLGQGNVKGTAEEIAKLGEGPVIVMRNQLKKAQEEIGQNLVPTLLELEKTFKNNILPMIDPTIKGLEAMASGIVSFVKTGPGFVMAVEAAGLSLTAAFVTNPVGAALAAIGAGILIVSEHLGKLKIEEASATQQAAEQANNAASKIYSGLDASVIQKKIDDFKQQKVDLYNWDKTHDTDQERFKTSHDMAQLDEFVKAGQDQLNALKKNVDDKNKVQQGGPSTKSFKDKGDDAKQLEEMEQKRLEIINKYSDMELKVGKSKSEQEIIDAHTAAATEILSLAKAWETKVITRKQYEQYVLDVQTAYNQKAKDITDINNVEMLLTQQKNDEKTLQMKLTEIKKEEALMKQQVDEEHNLKLMQMGNDNFALVGNGDPKKDYQTQKEQTKQEYDEKEAMAAGNEAALAAIKKQRRQQEEKDDRDYFKKTVDGYKGMSDAASNLVGSMFTGSAKQQKTAQKEMLNQMADFAVAQILMYADTAFAKDIAALPFPANIGVAIAEQVSLQALKNTIRGAISNFALGTSYAPGGPAIVGEQGPEMVYMPQGARVVNHNETKNSMGGTQIHVHLPSDASVDAVSVQRITQTIERVLPRTFTRLVDGGHFESGISKIKQRMQ